MNILNIFQREFPKEIKGVWIYYEFNIEKSKYCTDLWKGQSWKMGDIIPMLKNDKKIAFYKIKSCYYKNGNSMSDWATGDDGKNRDFKFHHTEKLILKGDE